MGSLFWKCLQCGFVYRDFKEDLPLEEEGRRYLTHENHVESEGYQNFLRPVVNEILKYQNITDSGLDYGSGPSSVIQYLLNQQGYQMQVWDPFFHPEREVLNKRYDFISCTEVVEHFRNPLKEFNMLNDLLKPKGRLYIKTAWTDKVLDFEKWHYHRDPTHLGFFNYQSFLWLSQQCNFHWIVQSESCSVFEKQ